MPLSPDISERRGAVVATALAGTVLLVVGYGSGIGVLPATSGGAEAAAAPPATSTPTGVTLPPPPPAEVSVDSVDTVGTTRLTAGLPEVQLSGPGIVYPRLPDGPTRPGPSSPSPTPPSSTPPPVTPPPGVPTPPAACTDLVGALLEGLTAYLGLPVVDVDLVRQVSDVLGLERYLASGLPLTDQLLEPLTPVLDVVPSVLGGLGLGAGPVRPDAALLQGLRTLLEVPVGAVTTVTDATLRSLLDAVVGGC